MSIHINNLHKKSDRQFCPYFRIYELLMLNNEEKPLSLLQFGGAFDKLSKQRVESDFTMITGSFV